MSEVRLLGGSGWNNPRLLEHGERYVEGAVFVDGFFSGSAEPKVARFVNEFKSIFGKTPDIFSALGYDAAQIIFSAIAQGAKTREDVRRHLAALRGFEGVMGLTDMGPDNDAHDASCSCCRFRRKKSGIFRWSRRTERSKAPCPARPGARADYSPQYRGRRFNEVSAHSALIPVV